MFSRHHIGNEKFKNWCLHNIQPGSDIHLKLEELLIESFGLGYSACLSDLEDKQFAIKKLRKEKLEKKK